MKSPKILVVDDSRTVRASLKRQLERDGAEVSLAHDGQEGFETAVSGGFDLIISDVEMPAMDGFTLCGKLKEHPRTRGVPVIILSTCAQDDDIGRGFTAGAAAYVVKERANQELLPRVREVLERDNLLRDRLFLVVDDSALIRTVLRKTLLAAGFRVVEAENGSQALDILGENSPDVIVSDINMPVMNGADFCERVRSRDHLAGVPFVVMSTESDRRIMREMMQKGASAYLVKPFNPEQLVILAEKLLSDHVRLLLQQQKMLSLERSSLLDTISSLIQALEARDVYTRGHSEAVADISRRIGLAMNLHPQELEKLTLAGKLHDIGKIGIRDDVLLKTGRLSGEEYEIIKRHPGIGAEILSPIPSMSGLIPAILHHHEHFDGRGYPSGLAGESIPLFARIIAVADVFHALTSQRPYRAPLHLEEALTVIADADGSRLCPKCVQAFLSFTGK